MVQWMRFIFLTLISGAACAAPEISVGQNESSLPDLGSETAHQEEQNNKGKSFKEQGADYITNSATQGFENLTPEALESQARSYLQSQITSSARSYIEGALSPYGKVRSNLSIGQGGIWKAVPSTILFPGMMTKVLFISASFQRNAKKIVQ